MIAIVLIAVGLVIAAALFIPSGILFGAFNIINATVSFWQCFFAWSISIISLVILLALVMVITAMKLKIPDHPSI